ncbi:MAG: hypothetical protein LBD04_06670 [Synergistaceae bacterium]|nr:hypothetical protein [Synergistaceae bacterium]
MGYEYRLADPLTTGDAEILSSRTVMRGVPSGQNFPAGNIDPVSHEAADLGAKEDIDAWCDEYGYYYVYYGLENENLCVYELFNLKDYFQPGAIFNVTDDNLIEKSITYGVPSDLFCNVLIGEIDDSLDAAVFDAWGYPLYTVIYVEVGPVIFREVIQGNMPIFRSINDASNNYALDERWLIWELRPVLREDGAPAEITDEGATHVCVEHVITETRPSKKAAWPDPQNPTTYGAMGFFDSTETRVLVTRCDDNISDYEFVTTVTEKEIFDNIVGGQVDWYHPLNQTIRESVTTVTRSADGNGSMVVDNKEIARNKYHSTYTIPDPAFVPPPDDPDARPPDITVGSASDFDYFELVSDTRATTYYRKAEDKNYSVTFNEKPYHNMRYDSTLPGMRHEIIRIPDGSAYGNDTPPMPETADGKTLIEWRESYVIWKNDVSIAKLGPVERRVKIPRLSDTTGIQTVPQLRGKCRALARNYGERLKVLGPVYLMDELRGTMMLTTDIEPLISRQTPDGFTIVSITHSYSAESQTTSFVGRKRSSQVIPAKRLSKDVMARIVELMKLYDEQHDNVDYGIVVRILADNKVLVDYNGERVVVDNKNLGHLFHGDRIPIYRKSSGSGIFANIQ